MITIDKNLCPQNHRCPAMKICPMGAISQNWFSLPSVDEEKCVECGKCVQFCPMGAIQKV